MTGKSKAGVSWNNVKAGLSGFDRTALLGLIQDLYAASKENQAFLHARLNLGGDPLKPYKAVISRWICPDIFKNEPCSVANAKKAIANYKKAIGYPEGMAELSVFYCEEAISFLHDCGIDDEGYYSALVRMYGQALQRTRSLPESERGHFCSVSAAFVPPHKQSAGALAKRWLHSGTILRMMPERQNKGP